MRCKPKTLAEKLEAKRLIKKRWIERNRDRVNSYFRAYYRKRHPKLPELSQESPESTELESKTLDSKTLDSKTLESKTLESKSLESKKPHTGGRRETTEADLVKSFEGYYTLDYWASENVGIFRACLKRPELWEIAERHFKKFIKLIIQNQRG